MQGPTASRALGSDGATPRKSGFAGKLAWGVLGIVVLVAATGVLWWWLNPRAVLTSVDGEAMHTVTRGDLRISFTERGEIKASKSIEVLSEVEGRSTIVSVVPEGTNVKKGDLLVELDSSELTQSLNQQQITVETAQATVDQAKEQVAIQRSLNDSSIQQAELDLLLAKLDLMKYTGERNVAVDTSWDALALLRNDTTRLADVTGRTREEVEGAFEAAARKGSFWRQEREKLTRDAVEATEELAEDELALDPEGRGPEGDGGNGGDEVVAGIVPTAGVTTSPTAVEIPGGSTEDYQPTVSRVPAPDLTDNDVAENEGVTVVEEPSESTPRSSAASEPGADAPEADAPAADAPAADAPEGSLNTSDFLLAYMKAIADVKIAAAEVARARNQKEWTERLAAKGYVTGTELIGDTLSLQKAEINEQQAKGSLELFLTYTWRKEYERYRSAVEQAEAALDRARKKADAELQKVLSDLKGKQANLDLSQKRLTRIEDQLSKTEILAPADGMVVYDQSRFGRGRETIIEAGAEVFENQLLMRLPDVTTMAVEVSVHESWVDQVRAGLPALVSIDALPNVKFQGYVTKVGILPDQVNRWLNPDLKVYETDVTLESSPNVEQLRPGMSARVEVIITVLKNVIFVPIQSVTTVERQQVCYLYRGGELVAQPVVCGRYNDSYIEVKEGLAEGDRIQLNAPTARGGTSAEIPVDDLEGMDIPDSNDLGGPSRGGPGPRGGPAADGQPAAGRMPGAEGAPAAGRMPGRGEGAGLGRRPGATAGAGTFGPRGEGGGASPGGMRRRPAEGGEMPARSDGAGDGVRKAPPARGGEGERTSGGGERGGSRLPRSGRDSPGAGRGGS